MAVQKLNNIDLEFGDIIMAKMNKLAGVDYNPQLEFMAKVTVPNDDYRNVETGTILVKMCNPKELPVDFGANQFRIYTKDIIKKIS